MNNIVSLSKCCEFIKDGTHGSPVRTQVGIPVLSATHVREGRLHFDTDRFTSEQELLDFQKRLKPLHGDVLLTIVGTIGRTAIIDGNRPLVFQRSVGVLRPKENVVISKYLRYALESDDVKSQFQVEKHEAAQAGIYLEALNEIKIPLPLLPEQKHIAALLDKADHLRRTRRYARQLSDTLLHTVFLEMFGEPVTNPMGWNKKELQELITSSRPITYGILKPGPDIPRGVPYIRVIDIQDNAIVLTRIRKTSLQIAEEYRRSKLQSGDLLLSIRGYVGRLAVVPDLLSGANITQDTARLAPYEPSDAWFLLGFFSTASMQTYMANFTRGAAVQGINLGDVKEIPVIVPPIGERQKYSLVVRKIERLRLQQAEAERQAEHLFQTLLHRAFSV